MKPVVNFDKHSPEYAANWQQIDRDLRENTPVAWSEAHGGFWIVTRHADVHRVLKEWETFSSENDLSGKGNGGKGILIPQNSFQFALSESDPPQATHLRNFEIPYFVAKNVAKWEAGTKQHANDAIDAIIDSGKIEFAHDYCVTVPAKTVMEFAGIPLDEWEVFALSAQDMARMPVTDPNYPYDKIEIVQHLLLELVHKRRKEPLDDIVSALANGALNGVPLSDEMVVGVLSAIAFGGFDTATTGALHALLFLNDKPDLRAAVKDDPKKMSAMVEELLRLFPPAGGTARTAVKDSELGGQQIKAGDRVLLLFSAANRDPAKFERPDEFWLERPNAAQHLAFGFGVHRCLGSMFAKMEIGVMLTAVLERLGDYQINESDVVRNTSIGSTLGFMSMPARFTPPSQVGHAA